MKKKDLVHVGTFGKAQGLKGEIRIIIFTSTLKSFQSLKNYFIKEELLKLNFIKFNQVGKKFIGKLENYNDRNAAESLNGKKIYSYREDFPIIENDQYYALDLIDCKVININNEKLGNIINVKNYGAGDLLEIINSSKKTFFIPMNKENVKDVNIEKKIIIVNPILGLIE